MEQMLLFLFPVFVSYLLQQLYGFADNIVLGRFVGKQALAAVGGSATSIINITLNCISGLCAAISVLVAQNYGRGNMEKVNRSVKSGMYTAVLVGLILGGLLLLGAPFGLDVMKEPPENRSESLTYLRFYALSLLFYFIYQNGISILRALGDSRRPLYLIIINALSKILFDLLFAAVFKLGVSGTSIATLLSYIISAAVVLFIFYHTTDIYQFSLKELRYEREDLSQIFKIGIPFAIQSMLFAIPNAIIQTKINEFGTDTIAAYTAYNSVDNLFWCFSNAIGTSTITMASQNYGSNNIARVRKIALTSILLMVAAGIVYGILFTVFGEDLLKLFVKDPNVLAISRKMLQIIAVSYVLYAFIEPLSAIFKSCGLINAPMYIAIFTIGFVRVGFIFFYPQTQNITPIYAFPLSWIVTDLAYIVYFLSQKRFRISKEAKPESEVSA